MQHKQRWQVIIRIRDSLQNSHNMTKKKFVGHLQTERKIKSHVWEMNGYFLFLPSSFRPA